MFSSLANADHGEKLTIYATNFEPYTIIENNEFRGIFVDLIILAAKRHNLTYQLQEAPFARALNDVKKDHPSTALVVVGRIPEREQQLTRLQLWLPMKLVYFTRSKVITNINEAKALKSICVRRKSAMDARLTNMGFTNIVAVNNEQQCALMLARKRIDAWFTLNVIGEYNYHILNLNRQMLTQSSVSYDFNMYFGVSNSTPQLVKDNWKKALRVVLAEGALQEISQKYYQVL